MAKARRWLRHTMTKDSYLQYPKVAKLKCSIETIKSDGMNSRNAGYVASASLSYEREENKSGYNGVDSHPLSYRCDKCDMICSSNFLEAFLRRNFSRNWAILLGNACN